MKNTYSISCLVLHLLIITSSLPSAEYDPLQLTDSFIVHTSYQVENTTDQRSIPLRIYQPENHMAKAVLFFSPGLGGNNQCAQYLGKHWASRGYFTVFLQHPGSDDSIWKNKKPREIKKALTAAMNSSELQARLRDVKASIDTLVKWNANTSHVFHKKIPITKIGMSGHSYGAVTTQALSGQHFYGKARLQDKRIQAACIFSPSSPDEKKSDDFFSQITIPWLIMTGSRDTTRVRDTSVENRLSVYDALSAGDKYLLFLHNAEHSAFTDHQLNFEKINRNPNHHQDILALSTAFWDYYLGNMPSAKEYLENNFINEISDQDRYEFK